MRPFTLPSPFRPCVTRKPLPMPHAVRFVPALALALALGGCASTRPPQANAAERLDTLAAWMSGIFTSEAQSKADAEFRNVRLVMYPIWTDRTDGKWLYAEQAVVESLDKPYRQRVYHLMVPRLAVETIPSFAPNTPARNQPIRSA